MAEVGSSNLPGPTITFKNFHDLAKPRFKNCCNAVVKRLTYTVSISGSISQPSSSIFFYAQLGNTPLSSRHCYPSALVHTPDCTLLFRRAMSEVQCSRPPALTLCVGARRGAIA
jgi:hypothetical protein